VWGGVDSRIAVNVTVLYNVEGFSNLTNEAERSLKKAFNFFFGFVLIQVDKNQEKIVISDNESKSIFNVNLRMVVTE